MTKILYIIIFLSALKTIRGQTTFAKTYCDCETVYKDTNYTGYCAEYFDIRLLPALNKKPHFKEYFLYVKGEKIDMWNYYHASKTDKVFLNDHEILENDSIKLLDGILKMVNKKAKINLRSKRAQASIEIFLMMMVIFSFCFIPRKFLRTSLLESGSKSSSVGTQ